MREEQLLFTMMIQLLVIMGAARLFATVFRHWKQPIVVGEIAAGIFLGPSFFGHYFPELSQRIFDPAVGDVFGVLSQLGLILLLFLVGLEFDFTHLRVNSRATALIAISGILVPFGMGCGLAAIWPLGESPATGVSDTRLGFVLFLGIAMSITAIPVLARLMMELNITGSRIGTVAISAAAVNDACGWILLATISSIVQARYAAWITVGMVLQTAVFFAVTLWIVRPLLRRFIRRALEQGRGDMSVNSLAVVYGTVFLCAVVTSRIGIFAIFGAFALGTVLSDDEEFRQVMTRHLRNFLTVIFLPIFFTYTGLQTDIGSLQSSSHWWLLAGVLLCAVAGKLLGCGLAARAGGFSNREALCIGALMNTRGLMELIVINVGRDLGVLPDSVFTMLVLMALLTTVMTTPLLLWFMKGTELEPLVRRSGFLGRERAAPS